MVTVGDYGEMGIVFGVGSVSLLPSGFGVSLVYVGSVGVGSVSLPPSGFGVVLVGVGSFWVASEE